MNVFTRTAKSFLCALIVMVLTAMISACGTAGADADASQTGQLHSDSANQPTATAADGTVFFGEHAQDFANEYENAITSDYKQILSHSKLGDDDSTTFMIDFSECIWDNFEPEGFKDSEYERAANLMTFSIEGFYIDFIWDTRIAQVSHDVWKKAIDEAQYCMIQTEIDKYNDFVEKIMPNEKPRHTPMDPESMTVTVETYQAAQVTPPEDAPTDAQLDKELTTKKAQSSSSQNNS